MVFTLESVKRAYRINDKNFETELEFLKKVGFSTQPLAPEFYKGKYNAIVGNPIIELNTIEDILKFVEDCDSDIIIGRNKTITIYNDSVES